MTVYEVWSVGPNKSFLKHSYNTLLNQKSWDYNCLISGKNSDGQDFQSKNLQKERETQTDAVVHYRTTDFR